MSLPQRIAAANSRQQRGDVTCEAMLNQMQEAHADLFTAMGELDFITREPLCDRVKLINARWRISQKSLVRRLLWSRIYDYLQPKVGAAAALLLSRLRQADAQLQSLSAGHVRQWTTDTVDQDWAGYGAASLSIRVQMASCIEMEKRLLHPMLFRHAAHGFDDERLR